MRSADQLFSETQEASGTVSGGTAWNTGTLRNPENLIELIFCSFKKLSCWWNKPEYQDSRQSRLSSMMFFVVAPVIITNGRRPCLIFLSVLPCPRGTTGDGICA
jgi:hypothetical protein